MRVYYNKMTYNTFFIFCIFALVSIVFMLINPFINHDKFYGDSRVIMTTLGYFSMGINVSSYPTSAFFLQPITDFLGWIGIDTSNYGLEFDKGFFFTNLVYMMIFFVPMFVLWIKKTPVLYASTLYLIAVMFVLYAPFYGVPSKEFVPFLLSFFSLLLFNKDRYRAGLVFFLATLTMYAFLGRTYFLVCTMVVLYHLICHGKWKIILIGYALIIIVMSHYFGSEIFNRVMYARPQENIDITNTWIFYKFNDFNYIGFVLNRIHEFFRLMFPIELLVKSVKYIPHVIFQLIISVYIFKVMFNREKYDKQTYYSALIIFAFTIAQALFEPDFGSYFRHKLCIFPFIYDLVSSMSRYKFAIKNKKSSIIIKGADKAENMVLG